MAKGADVAGMELRNRVKTLQQLEGQPLLFARQHECTYTCKYISQNTGLLFMTTASVCMYVKLSSEGSCVCMYERLDVLDIWHTSVVHKLPTYRQNLSGFFTKLTKGLEFSVT